MPAGFGINQMGTGSGPDIIQWPGGLMPAQMFGKQIGLASSDTINVLAEGTDGMGLLDACMASQTFPLAYTNGAVWDMVRMAKTFKTFQAVTITSETTIWTPTSGKKFRLMGWSLTLSVAGYIIIRDNTAGTVIAVIPSGAGGAGGPIQLGNGILSAAANNVLTAQGSAAGTLTGMVWGMEE